MRLNDRKTLASASLALAIAVGAPAVWAQSSDAQAAQKPIGGAALIRAQAQVVGIDPAANSITLKGPGGEIEEVAVNPEIADVSKLRVGDVLDIAYQAAVLLRLDKTARSGIRERIETVAALPASGGGTAAVHRVDVLATVQKVDRKHRLVTLRGPSRTVTLTAAPDVDISQLKPGDSVRAVFETATAVQVQPRVASQ
ncbi:MAG TPA: copper-binding protein [Paraburkholderia sp.]|jgi:Cu/Ag efflux protein CusF